MHLPNASHYWLKNAHIPRPLLGAWGQSLPDSSGMAAFENLVAVDLEIRAGAIASLHPAGADIGNTAAVDLRQRLVWCGFVDMHTHLDKGHIWRRAPNRSGDFAEALATVRRDSQENWDPEDVYRRMEFGLKCSYAHGTRALRTHIDSYGRQANISFGAFKALQEEWEDRLTLQAVCLVTLDYFMTPEGEALADLVAAVGGILGAVLFMNPDLEVQLDRIFTLARERNLSLDLHTDESGDPGEITLRHVAATALRHEFPHPIVCGHCCSLAVQPAAEAQKTIALVQQAGLGIVSLPMCNLYLQDRNAVATGGWQWDSSPQSVYTPRWRGVTLIHELQQAGVPVAIASDNCRDPFYAYGDHDMLEVFREGVRIAQLDAPYGNCSQLVTSTPAQLMGLPDLGQIRVGMPADLVIFKGRYFSELLARSQHDRVVLRNGQPIDTTLPDYSELDSLVT